MNEIKNRRERLEMLRVQCRNDLLSEGDLIAHELDWLGGLCDVWREVLIQPGGAGCVSMGTNYDITAVDRLRVIYIDDPISSLDEHNAISVACQIAAVIKGQSRVKAVVSTHHTLFFNALYNELGKNPVKLFLGKAADGSYLVRDTMDTPTFYHVANLVEMKKAADSGIIYTHHFNLLRSLMEKAASFHGLPGWKACVRREGDDPDGVLYERMIALMNHGGYSLFEPVEMIEENKAHFRRILNDFTERFPFNPELFVEEAQQAGAQ